MLFYLIIGGLLVLDQITKALIHNNFLEGDTLPIINEFFHLTYVQNRGVAFGFMQGKLPIINFISISAVLVMIYYLMKNKSKNRTLENYSWLFIISGALGNILDRIFRGFVVDMIDFRGIWTYIFNFADIYINIGVFLMILNTIMEEREKKRGGTK